MSSDPTPTPDKPEDSPRSEEATQGEAFLSISYRSRAATPLSRKELEDLVAEARTRNSALGITGMLLYDRGQFFQWLEGPPEAIRTIWRSIESDSRHVGIEVLGECTTPVRLFGGSALQLVCRDRDFLTQDDGELEALIADLAGRAMSGSQDAVDALLDERLAAGQDMRSLCRDLIEPAARRLGDWRNEDRLCDFEVTLALSHLQRSARRLGATIPPAVVLPNEQPHEILIATDPTEPNVLGATLVGDVFRDAGWLVEVVFSHYDRDVIEAVRIAHCEVLVLLLGDVYRHPYRLDVVAADIAAARLASCNPNLVVLVGGRVVLDKPDTIANIVGADAAFTTAFDAIEKARTLLGSRSVASGHVPRLSGGTGRFKSPKLPEELPPGWFWIR